MLFFTQYFLQGFNSLADKDNFLMKSAAWAARSLPAPVKRAFYKIPFLARFITAFAQ